jgi:hypothetical protein
MCLTRARWVLRLPHRKKPPRKKITPGRGGVSLTLDPSVESRNRNVYYCDVGGAQICVWIMFILIAVATFKIRYIHKKLPTTKTGLQGTLIFFGKSIFEVPFYGRVIVIQLIISLGLFAVSGWFLVIFNFVIVGFSVILTLLWVVMTLTCFTSILTLVFSSYRLISSLDSRTAVESTIQNQVTESGETTFQVADPNAIPNLGTVKRFAYFLALANLGIFACSLSYIILMFDCSTQIYSDDYDDYFFYG